MKIPELYTCIILKVAGKWYPTWKKCENTVARYPAYPFDRVHVVFGEDMYNLIYNDVINTYQYIHFSDDPEYYMLFDEPWDEKRALKVVAADILKSLYHKRGQWRAIRMWNKVLMDS